MSEIYVAAAKMLGWLLDAVEKRLDRSENGLALTARDLQDIPTARTPGRDEVLTVLRAMESLEILCPASGVWVLDKARLESSAGYRAGVRDVLSHAREAGTPLVSQRVCVALPDGVPTPIAERIQRSSIDLRAALIDVIASATERLVLASPFWDEAVATEVLPLLKRRLDAGVSLHVLARGFGRNDLGAQTIADGLIGQGNISLYRWFDPSDVDPFGRQTFHFKVVAADRGEKVYLGSANMTTAGLRSRMELGIVVSGSLGAQIADVVEAVLGLAEQVQWSGP